MAELSRAIEKGDMQAALEAARALGNEGAEAEMEELILDCERKYVKGTMNFPAMMGTVKKVYSVREELGIPRPDLGKAVVATLDIHTEGRNLMSLLLGIAGFETDIVEEGMMPDDIAQRCLPEEVTACVVSGEFSSIATKMKAVNDELTKLGIRDRIVYCCGGQPVSDSAAIKAGADVFDQNGAEAAKKVKDAVLARKKN
ncbi:MAG: cobalamin B12-binding domain-containing protein [Methanomethylophilus sp.]|jgi:trimethylamine corrinoid protein